MNEISQSFGTQSVPALILYKQAGRPPWQHTLPYALCSCVCSLVVRPEACSYISLWLSSGGDIAREDLVQTSIRRGKQLSPAETKVTGMKPNNSHEFLLPSGFIPLPHKEKQNQTRHVHTATKRGKQSRRLLIQPMLASVLPVVTLPVRLFLCLWALGCHTRFGLCPGFWIHLA